MDINFSIIIPHKNIPNLLQRCLDSIPTRDDVQVIIVDDNSNPDVVDFNNFPGIKRKNTEVYFTKDGKGAGFARNVGLSHAIGKWLIFLDSDDFLSENADNILNDNIDTPHDLIFYDNKTVMSDDINTPSTRDSVYHAYLQDYLRCNKNDATLRYCFHPLWGKIIRHSIVSENNIQFNEVKWSNDEYFSCKVGYYSKSVHAVDEILYIATQRSGSLTSNFCNTGAEFEIRLEEAIKSEQFLASHNVYPTQLQSDVILRKYFNNQGVTSFLRTLFSQRIFSDNQTKMIAFLLKIIKDKTMRILH